MAGNNDKFELIITIIDRGFGDEVMDAARAAGAKGGTIINGKGTGNEKTEQFFGIKIQPEKEMIMILTPLKYKKQIMAAINEKTGLRSKIQGICFSLPVDETIGLEGKTVGEIKKEN